MAGERRELSPARAAQLPLEGPDPDRGARAGRPYQLRERQCEGGREQPVAGVRTGFQNQGEPRIYADEVGSRDQVAGLAQRSQDPRTCV